MSVSQAALYERRHPCEAFGEAGRVCVRQNRVVPAVVATAKSCGCGIAPTGAVPVASVGQGRPEGIRLPGEHGISRPTIAQGRPCVRHHLYAAVRSLCATLSRSRPWVPAGTRPSLRPSFMGVTREQNSGETRREDVEVCLRDETPVGRATLLLHTPSLRAQRSNPESLRSGSLDCFVARAPRNDEWREHVPQLPLSAPRHPHDCGEIASVHQKNPLSTVARRTLMNQPRLVHKRRPAIGFRSASRAWI